MAKRSEERLRKKNRKNAKRKLLAWMDMDCTEIPDEVIVQLDELIRQRKEVIRSSWSPREEAAREGKDVRDVSKLVMSMGRFFESKVSCSKSDLE